MNRRFLIVTGLSVTLLLGGGSVALAGVNQPTSVVIQHSASTSMQPDVAVTNPAGGSSSSVSIDEAAVGENVAAFQKGFFASIGGWFANQIMGNGNNNNSSSTQSPTAVANSLGR